MISEENKSNEVNEEEEKKGEKGDEEKNEEIQFSQVLQKDSSINNASKQENLNNNAFSTRIFMKSIDLRCEDHLIKFQEDVEATRFCQKCNIICCDACIIDYHVSHIEFAKKKVDDYFISQKNAIVELNHKIKDSIKYKINEKEIDKIVDTQKKIVENFFLRRRCNSCFR